MGINLPRLFAVGLFSAVAGTLLDRIHTFFGVLRYARPCAFEESCWVPLIMGAAGVALALAHGLYRVLFRQRALGSVRALAVSGGDFAAAYLASGLFKDFPLGLVAGYSVLAALRIAQDSRPARVATVASAMVVGTLAEISLTHVGFFEYLHPNLFGLPYWIGGLYWFAGFAGVAIEDRWPVIHRSLWTPLDP